MASKKETKIGAQETEEGKDNIVHSHASARKQQRDERDAKRSAQLGRHKRTEVNADHWDNAREPEAGKIHRKMHRRKEGGGRR